MRRSVQHGAILAAHVCLALVFTVNEKLLRLPLLLDGSHEIKLALQVLPRGPHRLVRMLFTLSQMGLDICWIVLVLELCNLDSSRLNLDQVHGITGVSCITRLGIAST